MLITFLEILYYILSGYWYIMIAGVLLSWLPGLMQYKIFAIIRTISDWYLKPFQGKVILGVFDFTPIIGFMIYSGILSILNYVIYSFYLM